MWGIEDRMWDNENGVWILEDEARGMEEGVESGRQKLGHGGWSVDTRDKVWSMWDVVWNMKDGVWNLED